MSWYRQQLENWLGRLDVKADLVYDIGGAQGAVQSRVHSWDVKEYKILDLPGYNLEEDLPNKITKSADIIFCLEVFEYLIDPYQAMQNISNILKPGGKAYITFAFIYPHHEELNMDSTRYTSTGIARLALAHGMQLKEMVYRTDKSGLLKQFYSADGMHPSRNFTDHNVTGFIAEMVKL